MPVTPFHLGPAIVVKAACPRAFSLGVFALVQVAIDIETVARIIAGGYPVHGPLHTLAGSAVVALAALAPGKYGLSVVYAAVARRLAAPEESPGWVVCALGPVSWTAAISGALVGGVSHVVLDALIHPDVVPLAPWAPGNAIFVAGSFGWVHALCALLGGLGAFAWYARHRGTMAA